MRLRPKKSSRASVIASAIDFGSPFVGDIQCADCGLEVKGDRYISLNWRCLEGDRKRFYACPKCHPGSDDAGKEAWKTWMIDFVTRIMMPAIKAEGGRLPLHSLLYWRETGDGPPICEKVT